MTSETQTADVALMLEQEIDRRIVHAIVRTMIPDVKLSYQEVADMSPEHLQDTLAKAISDGQMASQIRAAKVGMAAMQRGAGSFTIANGTSHQTLVSRQLANLATRQQMVNAGVIAGPGQILGNNGGSETEWEEPYGTLGVQEQELQKSLVEKIMGVFK